MASATSRVMRWRQVTLTIEVEADAPDGFDGNDQRTISENATTLRLDTSDFRSELARRRGGLDVSSEG